MATDSFRQSLVDHLAWWGLKRFTSDAEYFAWQRRVLSPAELNSLHHHVEQKRRGTAADEVAFYDATADPKILPVLYSQRYDYYQALGPRVAARIADAGSILDVGCGVGILTTFYAQQFPDKTVVGIDRSQQSLERAREKAHELGLRNVRFECADVTQQALEGSYDLILATHALLQAEQDPGLPSKDWTTFERADDLQQQRAFEARTGVGPRLDRLCSALAFGGRMIIFEKTRQLARRVPFQRALAARGLSLSAAPHPIRYQVVEETADDGPFYLLRKNTSQSITWDENPEPDEGLPFDEAAGTRSPDHPDAPLYENHWPSAQRAWEQLMDRMVIRETTLTEPDGRQMHVELGATGRYPFLYCANTFDQRQLVVMDSGQQAVLEQYYREILSLPSSSSPV